MTNGYFTYQKRFIILVTAKRIKMKLATWFEKRKWFSTVFLLNTWVYFTDQMIIEVCIYVHVPNTTCLVICTKQQVFFWYLVHLTRLRSNLFCVELCTQFLRSFKIGLQNTNMILWLNSQKQIIHFTFLSSESISLMVFKKSIFQLICSYAVLSSSYYSAESNIQFEHSN